MNAPLNPPEAPDVDVEDDEIGDEDIEAEYRYHRSLGTSHELAMERCR